MAGPIPYVKDLRFEYGVLEPVLPNVRRLIARNPSPFTHAGTGTYVVGRGNVAVIDPGPALAEHLDALLHALRGEQVAHIVVTHTHADHSSAARALAQRTSAPTYGYGPHTDRPHRPEDNIEAGADLSFVPDHVLRDGDVLEGTGYRLQALHTPGHCHNHLCFALLDEGSLFTGDHVMGWSTSVIAPPDGDMGDYLKQLSRLLKRDDARYIPTHGPIIEDPKPLVTAYIRHRHEREAQILECLRAGPATITEMVERMYADVPRHLHPAAARSVHAHVMHMCQSGRLAAVSGPPSLWGTYERCT